MIGHELPINPSIHPPIHPPIGGGVSTNHKSSELNFLRSRFIQFLVFGHDPTQTVTQQPMHLPIGGGVSTNHKSSNRIELSQSCEDLSNF